MKIDYSLDDNIATIRLNVPEKYNAMCPEGASKLRKLLLKANRDARAVIIGGHGKAFCSGADLSGGMDKAKGQDNSFAEYDPGEALDTDFNPMIRTMRNLDIPIVTEVKGAAAGVGCSLALMGDIIITSEDAYFLQAFCNIGLVPDGGSSYLLSKAIGRTRAMEMMLLGERLPAKQALKYGLVNRVVPREQLETSARKMATKLAAGPTKSLALIRQQAWAGLDNSFEAQLNFERDQQQRAGQTEDHLEGVKAFLEKRKAAFKGR